MAKSYVSTTINGESAEYLCEPQQTLLDVLRDVVGLTGSKEGCASGDCGACTVIMDGAIVCSCLVLGVEAEGRTITTVEGIADGEKLHPVQQKFLEQIESVKTQSADPLTEQRMSRKHREHAREYFDRFRENR